MRVKLINASKQKVEYVFDGKYPPPILPGQIVELEEGPARVAMKQNRILDGAGNVTGNRLEILAEIRADRDRLMDIATFKCPYVEMGECNEGPFENEDLLRQHLEAHWAPSKPEQPTEEEKSSRKQKRMKDII